MGEALGERRVVAACRLQATVQLDAWLASPSVELGQSALVPLAKLHRGIAKLHPCWWLAHYEYETCSAHLPNP